MSLRFPKPPKRGPKPRKPLIRYGRPRSQGLGEWSKKKRLADELWRKIIRSRYPFCEACGRRDPNGLESKGPEFQAAHGISRRYLRTRWDIENGFKLCRGCHKKFTEDPLGWEDWLLDAWGPEKYERMKLIARSRGKVDLDIMIVLLQQLAGTKPMFERNALTRAYQRCDDPPTGSA